MNSSTPYEAAGFAFSDEKTMENAQKEAEGIRYVKEHLNRDNPEEVLRMYCQMIAQQLFQTPVGYTFLYELQEYLIAIPAIRREDIPPIPIMSQDAVKTEKRNFQTGKKTAEKSKTVHQIKTIHVNYKSRFRTSFAVNLILLLMVFGMFAVTATSGSINIVNYENALIEKYENWESDLKQREQKLRERERNQNQPQGEESVTEEDGRISLDQ